MKIKHTNSLHKNELLTIEQYKEALFLLTNQNELLKNDIIYIQNYKDKEILTLTNDKINLEKDKINLENDKINLEKELKLKDELLQKAILNSKKFQHLIFGRKSEKWVNPDQLNLFEITTPVVALSNEIGSGKEPENTEIPLKSPKTKHIRKTNRGNLPNLPQIEFILTPNMPNENYDFARYEITEKLIFLPSVSFIAVYKRGVYVLKQSIQITDSKLPTIITAELPSFPIEKSYAHPTLLAAIILFKYKFHFPLYRLQKLFKISGLEIADSTINGWTEQTLNLLVKIYDKLGSLLKKSDYLQADESTIKVLDNSQKSGIHLGYYWVYLCPNLNYCYFDYHPSRGQSAPQSMLSHFKGFLQTDGYVVYEKYAENEDITHAACLAHVRRKFFEAEKNDKNRAKKALFFIQELYKIEKTARENNFTSEARLALRQEKSVPIFEAFSAWLLSSENEQILPKSVIGEAFFYTKKRLKSLSVFLSDGRVEIDNNLIENKIRPLALGRKNYLFAGSHAAAQRAAMIYSLFACCEMANLNPYEWLTDILWRVHTTKDADIDQLLPHNWKSSVISTPEDYKLFDFKELLSKFRI